MKLPGEGRSEQPRETRHSGDRSDGDADGSGEDGWGEDIDPEATDGRRLWWILLCVGLAPAFIYVVVPYAAFAGALYAIATVLAGLGVGLAVRGPVRPFCPSAWLLVAAALSLAGIGHAIWYWLDLHGLEPFPSIADAFYLVVYPLFVAALIVLGRYSGHDEGAFSDALIVGVSAGVIGWAFLIEPFVSDPDLTLLQLVISAAYPVADIILLPMILRLMFINQARNRSYLFLLLGMLSYLAADILYAHGNSVGWYAPGGLTDSLWLVAYALFLAAAWHPSVGSQPPRRDSGVELPRTRLFILGIASLLTPMVILLGNETNTRIVQVAAGASVVLFLLVIYRMAGLLRAIHGQSERLERLSLTDPLTGAANRRYLDTELAREMNRTERSGSGLSLVFLDLDHFKQYNDAYGHSAGDLLLQELVHAWKHALRPSDLLARIGGEEFVLLLPDMNADRSLPVVERLRKLVPYGQTCSAGVAVYLSGDSADSLIGRADDALYEAKNSGRDRIVVSATKGKT